MADITVESTKNSQILLQLFDNYVPLLDPGDYTINAHLDATSAVDADSNANSSDAPDGTSTGSSTGGSNAALNEPFDLPPQIFTVVTPRFALPPQDVHACYPPANAQGTFEHVLPHLVLNKRMIPWERNVWGEGEHTTPWLALLVLDRSEILAADDGPSQGPPSNGQSSARNNPTGVASVSIHDLLHPTESDIAVPHISDDAVTAEHMDLGTTCRVIDISPETFRRVMPAKERLPYFAHSRRVRIIAKADNSTLHPDRDEEDDSMAWYSVVVASRFPAPPARAGAKPEDNVVHLVSLEGYADYFDDPHSDRFKEMNRVRLVSLHAWSFRCLTEPGVSFSGLVHGLVKPTSSAGTGTPDTGTPDTGTPDTAIAENLMLRVPIQGEPPAEVDSKAAADARKRLEDGYAALGFQTRQGEQTFSWYRGPFTPVLPSPLPPDRRMPLLRASQAMIYLSAFGVFDNSYSVAFEAGRLMALSSRSFGVNLLNWRRQMQQLIDLLVQRTALHRELTGLLDTEDGKAAAHQLLEQGLITDSFLSHLTSTFTEEVAPHVQGEILVPPDVRQIRPVPSGPNTTALTGLRSIFAQSAIQDLLALKENELLSSIVRWLARLALLYDLPFNHLVPDERMLPLESVRFFYLDRNWLHVLIEGALSIGVHHSRDELFGALTHDIILDQVWNMVHAYRDAALGVSTATPSDRGDGAYAGMLLRSALVDGWPGLEVHAYGQVDVDADFFTSKSMMAQTAATPMKLLRFSRLSNTVLLCLFPATPAWIEIDQPKESLHFEVQREGGAEGHAGQLVIYPRHVNGGETGKIMQGDGNKIVVAMEEESRQLSFGSGDTDLLTTIKKKLNLSSLPGPAAFAMQMIYTPQSMVFQNTLFKPAQ